MMAYTTQMDAAKKGIITKEMMIVANKESMDVEELRQLVAEGKVAIDLDGETFEVTRELVDIRIAAKEGFAVAMENNIFTIVDTTLTDELIDEGLARELISKVQQMRKQKDFEMMDNITITIEADDAVKAAVAKHADYIQKETLAVAIAEAEVAEKFDLNGHKTGIAVERV